MHDARREFLLKTSLEVAVPLWINQMRTWSFDQIQERAETCLDTIAHRGDIILYKSPKRGETAEAFNRLAEGIACLSFAPGGVTVLGLHFETHLTGRRIAVKAPPRRVAVHFEDLV